MNKVPVLNNGYVELVEWMGGDDAVIRNARRCWKSESKGEESDRKLLRHLLKNAHKTPLEAMVFTFDIKCPLFVARQWHRHRIGSYNEESLRYCTAERDFFIPRELQETGGPAFDRWVAHNESCFDLYEELTGEHNMRRELARSVLPVGIYTRFYWTVNGSSLMNFLVLRTDKHAQKEIQEYARAVLQLAYTVAPVSFQIMDEQVLPGGGTF